MKSDDMNKQESYKTYMILMISSDGNQNNVFFISARYRSPFCQVFGSPLSASLPSIWKGVHTKISTFSKIAHL